MVIFIKKFLAFKEYKQRGFMSKGARREIDTLILSSFQIITSLLEGNSSKEIYNQLFRLNITHLKIILLREYSFYIKDTLNLHITATYSEVENALLKR